MDFFFKVSNPRSPIKCFQRLLHFPETLLLSRLIFPSLTTSTINSIFTNPILRPPRPPIRPRLPLFTFLCIGKSSKRYNQDTSTLESVIPPILLKKAPPLPLLVAIHSIIFQQDGWND